MSITAPSSSFISLLPRSAILLLRKNPEHGSITLADASPCELLCCSQTHLYSCLPSFINYTLLFSPPLGEPWTITASTECPSIESGHPCLPQWSLTPARPSPIAMCTCLLLQAAVQTWLVSSREITDLLRIWTVLFSLQPFPQKMLGAV